MNDNKDAFILYILENNTLQIHYNLPMFSQMHFGFLDYRVFSLLEIISQRTNPVSLIPLGTEVFPLTLFSLHCLN